MKEVISPRITLGKSVKVKVYSSVESSVWSLVYGSLDNSVNLSVRSSVWNSVSGSVTNSINIRL